MYESCEKLKWSKDKKAHMTNIELVSVMAIISPIWFYKGSC